MNRITPTDIQVLEASGSFDPAWYVARYPDVALSGLAAAEHYLWLGRRLGRPGRADGAVEAVQASAAEGLPIPVLPDDIRLDIEASGFFDTAWYIERYGKRIVDSANLIDDYIAHLEVDPDRDPGPLFSTRYYRVENPDVVGVHPLIHFARYGISEGRRAFSPEKVNALMAQVSHESIERLENLLDPARPVCVLHWAEGNFFFTEIAGYVVHFLRDRGYSADVRDNDRGIDLDETTLLVVAPHEYCVHGPGKRWAKERLAAATYFNTEQWHTSWFTLTYSIARHSGRMIDMNPASAAALARLGFRSAFIPLLPLEGSVFRSQRAELAPVLVRNKFIKDLTYPENFGDRPYAACFFGVANPRRIKALARLAPALSGHESFLHCPAFNGPVRAGDPDMVSGGDFAQIARNSRILLNIHQGESHYFEWHRLFVSGMMEGCVVVTEPCGDTGPLKAGEHFLEASLADMPNLLAELLGTSLGAQRMAKVHGNCLELRRRIDAGERLDPPWS